MGLLLDDTLIMDADIPIDLIDNHPSNPNLHSPAQIEQLAESHNSYGQYRRVLVWARPNGRFTLVAGHGFTQGATLDGRSSFTVSFSSTFITNQPSEIFMSAGLTVAEVYYRATANGASTVMGFAEIGTGANANVLQFSGTYIAA